MIESQRVIPKPIFADRKECSGNNLSILLNETNNLTNGMCTIFRKNEL